VIGNLPFLGGLDLKQIIKLDQWMTHYLGRHFQAVEKHAVNWLGGLDQASRRYAKAALSVAAPVWGLAYWLVHVEIGRQAKAHDKPIARNAAQAKAIAKRAEAASVGAHAQAPTRTNTKTVTKVERVVMPHAEEWTWINHHWQGLKHAISLAAAGVLAPTLPRVKPLAWPRGLTPTAIRRRLGRVEALLGVTAFAAVMARVLRVTPRCLTDGNVGKVARRLCGLSARGLEDLLGFLVDAFLLVNICETITLMEQGLSLIDGPLNEWIGTADKMFVHCKYDLPPKLAPVRLSLPPLSGLTLSL
jgi:hypothetical protein